MIRSVIRSLAPAKINLALHVIGRRDDGYHLLDMLVAFADFGDTVTWDPGGASCRLRLRSSSDTGANPVPEDTSNLAWRALALAGRTLGRPDLDGSLAGTLSIDKRLPSGAGIGGGSSDAAAVLRLMLGSDCFDKATIDDFGLSLGADVPVCLAGRPSRVRGIGERVDPVALARPLPVVLIWPGIGLPTPTVFKARSGPFAGGISDESIDRLAADPLEAIAGLRNDLEPAATRLEPLIGAARGMLERLEGCRLARMSGSGTCMVGYFTDPDAADLAARAIAGRQPGWWIRSGLLTT